MIYKSVIPIRLKRKEHVLWKTSAYKAIAGIDDCQSVLANELKGHLLRMLEFCGVAICIVYRLPEIKVSTITSALKNSIIQGCLEPKGDFLVRPGAVIALTNSKQDITQIAEYWGTFDGIQFIFPNTNSINDLIKLVSTERYIYYGHRFDVWNELMNYAKLVITDTSTGSEFEMVYHKNDNVELLLKLDAIDAV